MKFPWSKQKEESPNINRLCKDCEHTLNALYCRRDIVKSIGLVDGNTVTTGYLACVVERNTSGSAYCGPSGKFFKRAGVIYTETSGDTKYELTKDGIIYKNDVVFGKADTHTPITMMNTEQLNELTSMMDEESQRVIRGYRGGK